MACKQSRRNYAIGLALVLAGIYALSRSKTRSDTP
jgi:hypothetical protein